MKIVKCLVVALVPLALTSCWLGIAGAGAEAGYVLSQEDRTAAETLSDQAIVASVKTKLLASSKTPGMDINVDSFKGNVTLKGVVDSEEQVRQSIRLAHEVEGVKTVTSKLHVSE